MKEFQSTKAVHLSQALKCLASGTLDPTTLRNYVGNVTSNK